MKILLLLSCGLIVSLSALSSNQPHLTFGTSHLSADEIALEMDQKLTRSGDVLKKRNSLKEISVSR